MTAPAPSPAEAAIIDRFGIFDEERAVEEVARAIYESDRMPDGAERLEWGNEIGTGLRLWDDYRANARAAITAYRATQDGGAEDAVRRSDSPPFSAPTGKDLLVYEQEVQRLYEQEVQRLAYTPTPVETCALCFRPAHPGAYCFGEESAPVEDDEPDLFGGAA